MKLLHKLILPLVAAAGLVTATPAQAGWFHRHFFFGPRVVVGGWGYPYYGYYGPYYGGPYYGYYGGPVFGGGFAFGGHGYYYSHGHYYRGGRGGYSHRR